MLLLSKLFLVFTARYRRVRMMTWKKGEGIIHVYSKSCKMEAYTHAEVEPLAYCIDKQPHVSSHFVRHHNRMFSNTRNSVHTLLAPIDG